jgi:hypothetical protein
VRGPEHYREAARLVELASRTRSMADGTPQDDAESYRIADSLTAEAGVHAQLATAAAIGGLLADRYVGDGEHITRWAHIAGLPPVCARKVQDGAPF